MFLALISANIGSDSGCMCRPLAVGMLPGSQPASAAAAVIAADVRSARVSGREPSVNWKRMPPQMPTRRKAYKVVGGDPGKIRPRA